MTDTRQCPGCDRTLEPLDTGYVLVWDCGHEDCGWADAMWQVYDWDVFAQVKHVQREVGQAAAERLAAEFKSGALS